MIRGLLGGLTATVLTLVFASSAAAFDARGSVEQVYATGLTPGAEVSLLDSSGGVVESRNANDLGGTLFRNVTPGSGYRVRSGGETSGPLTVLTKQSAPPSTDVYNQEIPNDGYGYLATRDGTKLAYSVHPPTDVKNALGGAQAEEFNPPANPVPAPTLIEYGGYAYARPEGPTSGISALANLMGYTVVDIQMRGTGCSGGAFDFFEPLQNLDGYDIVETVSRQPWVAHNKVGMMGISYGGISQLFTGQTQPPSLAAIAPLSVIDQTQTTLYPGGILNTGFAFNWAQERMREARPADPNNPNNGAQPYAAQRIQEGDTTCAENQTLHPEAADLEQKIRENDHYIPEVADPVSPITFVDKINVPTFMACQWTDEQTGGHCPTLAEHMTGTDKKWFTYTNGTHVDSLSPEIFSRMYDFFEIYVAQENPAIKAAAVRASFPAAFQGIFGIDGPFGQGEPPIEAQLPRDPIQEHPTYEMAKAAWEAQPPVRVLFDNGAGENAPGRQNPGWPYPGFEQSFELDQGPDSPGLIEGTEARAWYVGPNGSLTDQPSGTAAADKFTWDAHARPLTNFTGDTGSGDNGLWTATPPYNWTQDPPGSAVAYATPPLSEDTAVVGAGRADLWVRSSAPDVMLQATISEVRPDGKETFVQGGWLRTVARSLSAEKSTELEPVQSFLLEDYSDLPSGEYEKVTIPLYYEGHMYRKDSQIRVRISAPNGDQPIWSFSETVPAGQADVEIGYGGSMDSRLLLPVIPGVSAPTELPPCPGLRGEPCRDYQPFTNAPGVPPVEDEDPGPGPGPGPGEQGGQAPAGGGQTTGSAPAPAPRAKPKRCKKPKRGAAAAKKRCKPKKR